MASVLIDLDAAPAGSPRPGRPHHPARSLLAGLSLLLVAALGAAAPPAPDQPPAAVITAQPNDDVLVHGDRLWVVDAATGAASRSIRSYRLPDGKLLAGASAQIPDRVVGVFPVGATTLIEAAGQQSVVLALDEKTGQTRWRRSGDIRGLSADPALLLLSDDSAQEIAAVDPATGASRWQVRAPAGGSIDIAGEAGSLPRWLVGEDPHGRLDTYDGRTGRHLATARSPAGPATGAAGDLLFTGTDRSGITAYTLPGLTVRWHRAGLGPSLRTDRAEIDCGDLVCITGPALTTVDPVTGQTRWTSDRWAWAERDGPFLLARSTDEPPDLGPVTVLDAATGRVRAELGDWRVAADSAHPLADLVDIRQRTLFGRFDPADRSVHVLATTDLNVSGCHASPVAMVCRLVGGPAAVWRPGPR